MRQAIETMLSMQDGMNTRVHEDWINQQFAWYRAIWIECGELMDHVGYKWWKKQEPDLEQVRLEVIDIWHFGLSALFRPGGDMAALAQQVELDLYHAEPETRDIRAATEALAEHSLRSKGFSVSLFAQLMAAADLSFDELYRRYIGKNVLNFFRQDHGYKEGTYQKLWQGREDNEHLSDIISGLDSEAEGFPDAVYAALTERYPGAA
ncbi:MAG: dUTP diphosphatase [Cellvibrionales bacterium]|jgi:dimeric dUTPase (all-alpha-NTP-PPase superfamily)